MKRLALSLIALFLLIGDASAASKFWVGGGTSTNWDASPTTNWANTSGGAGNQTVPVAGDSVFFDGNSGTGAAVWNTAISLATLDCTGSKNLVTHNSILLTISSGNLVLPTGAGGTYTAVSSSSQFTFSGTSGTQRITTNGGKPGNITLNGVGGTFQLQDNLAMLVNNSAIINLTAGTWDSQSFTVSAPFFSSASATSVRAMVGSGAYTIGAGNSTGGIWNISAGGTLTITSFTSNVNFVGTTGTGRSVQGGGASLTWLGSFNFGANSSGGSMQILGINNFGGMQITGPNNIVFTNTTTTFATMPTIVASSGNEVYLSSNTVNTQRGFVVASGTATYTWTAFRDIAFSGGATFNATSSFDLGNNTGINFGGSGSCIIGGWLLWRDLPSYDQLPEVFDHEPANDNSPAFLGKTG